MFQNVQLLGFAPDLPTTTPGVFVQTVYTMPTDHGFGCVPTFNEQGASALNTQSLGGFIGTKTDGTQRVFAGSATKLYETTNPPNVLTDRSGGAMLATTSETWSFAQFGDATLASNANDFLQFITSGSAFAAVGSGPVPKARIICTCGPVSAPIVMAFDYDSGSGRVRDGWFASGLGDAITTTGWTTGTNSCVNGRLLDDIPGGVTAGIGYRDDVVAFKRTGMYMGTFTGDATDPWSWRRMSGSIGCIGKNALVKAEDKLYWADESAIWEFDGSYPRKIPGSVHNFWAATCVSSKLATAANANFFHVTWDRKKHWLNVFSGVASGPSVDIGLTWNSISGLWTAHGGIFVGAVPFTNAAGTAYAAELLAENLYVTNNKKIGSYTYDVGGGEPPGALIDGWLIADFDHVFMLRGIRPHWRIYSALSIDFGGAGYSDASGTPPGGFFRTYDAPYLYTDRINSPVGAKTCTSRNFGMLEQTHSGPFISFRVTVPAGVSWEIDGLSVDSQVNGRT